MENITSPTPEIPIEFPKPKTNYFNLILISFAFVLFFVGAYFLGKQSVKPPEIPVTVLPQSTPIPTQIIDPTANWKTFKVENRNFTFQYPTNWRDDFPRNGSSQSITNLSPPKGYWFNVYDYNSSSKTISDFLAKRDKSQTSYFGEEIIPNRVVSHKKMIINGLDCIQRQELMPNSNSIVYSTYFQKDNDFFELTITPSGRPELATEDIETYQQILSTFKFTENKVDSMRVKIYQIPTDVSTSCESVDYLEVDIPKSVTPLKDSINYLISNLKDNRGFKLVSATISNGVATLTFDDPNFFSSGGSCWSGELSSIISKTAIQFPSVKSIKFIGPEHLFQP